MKTVEIVHLSALGVNHGSGRAAQVASMNAVALAYFLFGRSLARTSAAWAPAILGSAQLLNDTDKRWKRTICIFIGFSFAVKWKCARHERSFFEMKMKMKIRKCSPRLRGSIRAASVHLILLYFWFVAAASAAAAAAVVRLGLSSSAFDSQQNSMYLFYYVRIEIGCINSLRGTGPQRRRARSLTSFFYYDFIKI